MDIIYIYLWIHVDLISVGSKIQYQASQFLPLGLSGWTGISVACVCLSIHLSVCKHYLVRMITRHRFELESPNLHQTCILGYSQLVLKMGVIDLYVQGHFGHFDFCWSRLANRCYMSQNALVHCRVFLMGSLWYGLIMIQSVSSKLTKGNNI